MLEALERENGDIEKAMEEPYKRKIMKADSLKPSNKATTKDEMAIGEDRSLSSANYNDVFGLDFVMPS